MIIENELKGAEIAVLNAANIDEVDSILWRVCCAMATNIELNMRKIKELDDKLAKHDKTVGLHTDNI